jgi:uncharacterized membrane protein (UPF0127 family)
VDNFNASHLEPGDRVNMPAPSTGPAWQPRPRLLLAFLVGVASAAWGSPPAPQFGHSTLAIESASERFEFQVEVASSPEQRAHGLMYRRHLPSDHGMLFDFGASRPVSMWMRNTYIPLDMLFIEKDGNIARIAVETEPLSEEAITSGGPVKAVLELQGGITAKLGIRPGDRVVHPLFADP